MNTTLKQVLVSLGVVVAFLIAFLLIKVPKENVLGGGSSGQEVTVRGLIDDGYSNMVAATTNTPPTFNFPFGELGYRKAGFQFTSMGNVTGTIFASNDTGKTWLDITNDIIASSSFSVNRMVYFDGTKMYGKLRFRFTTSSISSTWSIRSVFSN